MVKGRVATYLLVLFILGVFVLRLSGFLIVVVLTNSMVPTINPGDAVVIAPKWLDKPHLGDVVAFKVHTVRGDVVIVHRLVGVRDGGFVTKGDNRDFTDPWVVHPDQIIGVAVLRIPKVGWVLYWLSLFSPLILVGVLLWGAWVVYRGEKRRYAVMRGVGKGMERREVHRVGRVKKKKH